MKIALVHDELVRMGGAEQVLLSFHKAFPHAPIYTLSYNPETTYPEFKSRNIKTSWLGRLIKDEHNLKRFFFPFGVMAMRQLNLEDYDVVLQSTTHCSKYVRTSKDALIITYCHTPFRLVYRPNSYDAVTSAGFLKKKLYKTVISQLRKIDEEAAKKTSYFVTNAREVIPRILSAYQPDRDITVINPAVKCSNFYVAAEPGDYYLVVSRFEPYKKIDLVIKAFNKLPDKKLFIVGKGSMEKALKSDAADNITFLGSKSNRELASLYAHCKALIFPQHEDYGITPLEANASGRPVIAFGKGGVLDTMIPFTGDAKTATAVFFNHQNSNSLIVAINEFETLSFCPDFIRAHAETFDEAQFVKKIKNFVRDKYELKLSACLT